MDELPIDRKELAKRAKCSPGTLSDWINNKRPVREHLHDAIMQAIGLSRHNSGREPQVSESVKPGVALQDEAPEYLTIAECKQRINELNQEVERLRAALHAISAPRPVSSSPPSAAAELARRAGGDAGKNPKS